jgi:hypothetical protein
MLRLDFEEQKKKKNWTTLKKSVLFLTKMNKIGQDKKKHIDTEAESVMTSEDTERMGLTSEELAMKA